MDETQAKWQQVIEWYSVLVQQDYTYRDAAKRLEALRKKSTESEKKAYLGERLAASRRRAPPRKKKESYRNAALVVRQKTRSSEHQAAGT